MRLAPDVVELVKKFLSWHLPPGDLGIALVRSLIWILWDFSGLRLIFRKIYPRLEKDPPKRQPSAFFLWFVGIYVAQFQIALERYQSRIDNLENRANLIIAKATENPKELQLVPAAQKLRIPVKPGLWKPEKAIQSLWGEEITDPETIELLTQLIVSNKHQLAGLNLTHVDLPETDPDPSNAVWQRDLSVSHIKVGDVLRAHGDLDGALAAYREARDITQRLAETDPSNAVWQRDLSLSQDNIGDVLRAHGDLAGALAAYREAQHITQRLAETDPSNAVWQRDLSLSQDNIGDVLRAHGDLAGALAAYREAQHITQRLAKTDPSNAVWQRDLSVSHNKVGDVLRAQGDLDGALAAYGESLELRQRLAEADPSNAD